MHEPQRPVAAGERPQHGQGQGVVPAQGQGRRPLGDDAVKGRLDDAEAGGQVVRIHRHIPDIRHLQAVERCGAGGHVVGAQQARFGADLPRTEARAGAVGGAAVQGHAHEAGVQPRRILTGRQAAHGGRAREPGHGVAAQGLVERFCHETSSGISARRVLPPGRSTHRARPRNTGYFDEYQLFTPRGGLTKRSGCVKISLCPRGSGALFGRVGGARSKRPGLSTVGGFLHPFLTIGGEP